MIEITNAGKYSLALRNPVMIASGIMGFDPLLFRDVIALDTLGAIVTAGVTAKPRKPARGARVLPYTGGVVLHTGLPNAGVSRVIKDNKTHWERTPTPMIVHVVANRYDDVLRTTQQLEGVPNVVAVELGFHDQVHPDDLSDLIRAARQGSQLPILAKLPLHQALYLVEAAEMAQADALVIASPPRSVEEDPATGRLVGGRLYGSALKGQVLYILQEISEFAQKPLIACGGIHNVQDARDYLDAGATAVQIDTLAWIQPSKVTEIAQELQDLA